MRAAVPLLLALVAVSWPRLAGAEPPRRPPQAPLFGHAIELPPTPPEYLAHDADGIRFRYHPSGRERVRSLIEHAASVRAELEAELAVPVLGDVEVRVAVGPGDFARIVPAELQARGEVLVLSEAGVLVISLPSAPVSASEVLANFRMGLAYLALDEATERRGLPRWFRMGYALRFADRGAASRFRALWWASMEQRLVPLEDLDWYLTEPPPLESVPAAEAVDFVSFLLEPQRAPTFPVLLERIREGRDFDEALMTSYQKSLSTLEQAWRQAVARHKAFLPVLLGGTGLWMLIALAVQGRRHWRRRALRSRTRAKPVRGVARERPSRTPNRPKLEPPRPRVEPPEIEVPKVSHDGRWHTLH